MINKLEKWIFLKFPLNFIKTFPKFRYFTENSHKFYLNFTPMLFLKFGRMFMLFVILSDIRKILPNIFSTVHWIFIEI